MDNLDYQNFYDNIIHRIDHALENPLSEHDLAYNRNWNASLFNPMKNSKRFDQFLRHFILNGMKYYEAYNLLSDDLSKQYYRTLILIRIVGVEFINSPRNNPEYWQAKQKFYDNYIANNSQDLDQEIAGIGKLKRVTVPFHGHNITLDGIWWYMPEIYALEQYSFNRNGVRIAPEKGDIVIDAGAFNGDSAFAFAAHVGSKGFVYSFEIDLKNVKFMENNLSLNPELSKSIEIINKALVADSNEKCYVKSQNGSSHILSEKMEDSIEIDSITIDDFVKSKKLDKLNFIKMDIEGAELSVLRGAKDSLSRFKPKLAICIYHNQDDFYSIINYINSLGLNYEFYVDHYGSGIYETIAYARAK